MRPLTGVALLVMVGTASAQLPTTPDAVERLRLALRVQDTDAGTRGARLKQCADNLHGVSELGRAVLLREWRSMAAEAMVPVDAGVRSLVGEWFQHEARDTLRRGNVNEIVVVLDLLAEAATVLRQENDDLGIVRPLGPDVANLVRRGDARLRAKAARVLGQIDAEAVSSVTVLAELLRSAEPALRCAAVDGLAAMLDVAPVDLPQTAVAVLPLLGAALADPSTDVSRAAADALGKAAALTARLIGDPLPADDFHTPEGQQHWQALQARRSEVRPILIALHEQGPSLVRTLAHGDRETRLAAQKAFDRTAEGRQRWLRQAAGHGPADDMLLDTVRAALPVLAEALGDPEVRLRLSAVEALASVGPAAAPAVPALTAALEDRDCFVRWAAVRALRQIGPAAAPCAMPGLVRLLEDANLDVRLAAAAALLQFVQAETDTRTPGRLSPVVRTALLPLLRSLRATNPEVRMAAIATVRALGPDGCHAIPGLREALADPNPHVRQAAAEALGCLGPAAAAAANDLCRAARDDNEDVRRAAVTALANVTR